MDNRRFNFRATVAAIAAAFLLTGGAAWHSLAATSQQSLVGSQQSAVGSQSAVGGQQSAVGSQQSAVARVA